MEQIAKRTGCAVAAVALLSLTTAGCFGSFGLTRKVHDYNQNVHSDKWAQEGVFLLGISFLPVYGLAATADAVFFNAVEFWTGRQMIAVDESGSSAAGATHEAHESAPPAASPASKPAPATKGKAAKPAPPAAKPKPAPRSK